MGNQNWDGFGQPKPRGRPWSQSLSMKPRSSDVTKWKPPVAGRYKVKLWWCNFQWYKWRRFGSYNMKCPRPSHGVFMLESSISTLGLEASAARWALQFAIDLGLMEIDLEGDSTTIVDALLLSTPCTTIYGHIIDDIK